MFVTGDILDYVQRAQATTGTVGPPAPSTSQQPPPAAPQQPQQPPPTAPQQPQQQQQQPQQAVAPSSLFQPAAEKSNQQTQSIDSNSQGKKNSVRAISVCKSR